VVLLTPVCVVTGMFGLVLSSSLVFTSTSTVRTGRSGTPDLKTCCYVYFRGLIGLLHCRIYITLYSCYIFIHLICFWLHGGSVWRSLLKNLAQIVTLSVSWQCSATADQQLGWLWTSRWWHGQFEDFMLSATFNSDNIIHHSTAGITDF